MLEGFFNLFRNFGVGQRRANLPCGVGIKMGMMLKGLLENGSIETLVTVIDMVCKGFQFGLLTARGMCTAKDG